MRDKIASTKTLVSGFGRRVEIEWFLEMVYHNYVAYWFDLEARLLRGTKLFLDFQDVIRKITNHSQFYVN